jgi:hypothetical protein
VVFGVDETPVVEVESERDCAGVASCWATPVEFGSAIAWATVLVLESLVQKTISCALKYIASDGPHATRLNGYTPTVTCPAALVFLWRNHGFSMCGDGDQSSVPKYMSPVERYTAEYGESAAPLLLMLLPTLKCLPTKIPTPIKKTATTIIRRIAMLFGRRIEIS